MKSTRAGDATVVGDSVASPAVHGRRSGGVRSYVEAGSLTVARAGCAAWFVGNLYEATVRVPDLLASRPPTSGGGQLLAPGSPVRYYLPVGPLTAASTALAVTTGWRHPRRRPWLVVGAVGLAAGGALTGYLVPAVNVRLIKQGTELAAADRERLLRRWYTLNTVRLTTVAGAWLALTRAARRAR